jgi:tetratricopeptide (TPR) repeat protein
MLFRLVICIFGLVQSLNVGYCQGINKTAIWKRLVSLRDSSALPVRDQIAELLTYEKSLQSVRKDSVTSFLFQRIGASYYKMSDFHHAEKYIRHSIQIVHDSLGRPFINTAQLSRTYYILSLICDSLNNLNESRISGDSCISVSIRTETTDIYLLYTIRKKAEYLSDIGDYHRCINYAKEGTAIAAKILRNTDSLQYIMQFIIWEVNSYISLNEYDEAEKLVQKTLNDLKLISSTNILGVVYERLAAIKAAKSEYKLALHYFNESIRFDVKNKNYLSCLQTLVNMGNTLYYEKLNDKSKALHCLNSAVAYANKLFNNRSDADSAEANIQLLNIYDNMANVYIKYENYDSAEYYFKKSFSQIGVRLNNNNLIEILSRKILNNKANIFITNTLLDAGESLLKEYKHSGNLNCLNESSQIFTIADKLEFKNKNRLTEIKSKLFWRNKAHRFYENAIEVSYLLGNKDMAFYFFEKSRAQLLNDQLTYRDQIGDDDAYKTSLLKRKILQMSVRLESMDALDKQYAGLQNELFTAKQELNILEQSIKDKNPVLYQAMSETDIIGPGDVRASILNDHAALLELFNGDSAIYVIMITSLKIFLNKIPKADFDETVELYDSYLMNPSLLNMYYSKYKQVAQHLFNLVFGNMPVPGGRIVISPDGKYFPFESLVIRENGLNPVYFLSDYTASYTYSARFLMNDFSKNKPVSKEDFFGVAPINYSSNFQLTSLLESDASLYRIGVYFHGSINLVAEKATKANFLQQFPDYKIIQLYTHSSDSSNNKEPVIYFADSALYLSELIPENKNAVRLIVLSACETGNGKLNKGEGVFSFNRGFAALGIPSSIINLWSVDNESTYKLTELFYKYAAQGIPLDISLQKAKLEFIATSSKEKRLPFYWAAAILAGKTDAVEIERSSFWLKTIIAAIIISILLFIVNYNRRNLSAAQGN